MSITFPKTFKNCSTCKHWKGERSFSKDKAEVHVDSPTSQGDCKYAKDGPRAAFMKCDNWVA